MYKAYLTGRFLMFFSLLGLFGATVFGQTVKTEEWFVADKQVECRGVTPQKCLVVRQADSADWKYFYSAIKNFKFRDGYTQKIRVSVAPRRNVPADASALEYRLVKVLSRSKTDGNTVEEAQAQMKNQKPLTFDNRKWVLTEIEGAAVENVKATMEFDEKEKRFGAKICNGMGGSYEQTGANIKFSSVIGTMMACDEPIQSTENRFRRAVEKVTRAARNGDSIVFYNGNQAVLKLSAETNVGINQPLEATKWALLDIEGEPLDLKGEVPYLQLDKEKMTYAGFSGCNGIFGRYETSGVETIKFSGGAMSRRACLSPEAQAAETKISEALRKINRYENKNGVLSLYAGDRLMLKLTPLAK